MKRMFVLSILFLSLLTASSQSVGIGTSSPGEKLDVVGNVKAGSPASNAIIGTHPTYGNLYSAFWKQGYDYSILTDGTNTFLNAPSGSGGIYFRLLISTGLQLLVERIRRILKLQEQDFKNSALQVRMVVALPSNLHRLDDRGKFPVAAS